MKMNIKKRLAVSNLLMLLIPVAVVLITGLVFLIIIFSMLNSDGFRFGEERFYDHKDEIVGMIEDCLSSDSPSDGLTDIINSAGQSDLRIIVEENGETIYEAGVSSASDGGLLSMSSDGESVFVSDGTRQLYRTAVTSDGRTYMIAVF